MKSVLRTYPFWIALAILAGLVVDRLGGWSVEGGLFDLRAYLTASGDLDPKIIVCGVDRVSIVGNRTRGVRGLGRFPWHRKVWAKFLAACRNAGVKLVVFDINFDKPTEGDGAMFRELAKGPPAIFARELSGVITHGRAGTIRILDPAPAFRKRAAALGFINVNLEQGSVRAVPLAARVEDRWVPSLDLAAAMYLTNHPALEVKSDRIVLGQAEWPTTGEHEFLLRWANPHQGLMEPTVTQRGIPTSHYISVSDMLKPGLWEAWRERIRGSILIVGATDPDLKDQGRTPVGVLYGPVIHANVLNALLYQRFYRPAGMAANVALLVLPAVCLSVLIRKRSAARGALIMAAFLSGQGLLNLWLFAEGYWTHLASPLLATTFVFVAGNIHQRMAAERRREEIARIYGRYLAPQVRDQLLKEFEERKAELHGALREVSVLESDIRGFTSLSENLPAEEVVRLLNVYFTAMIPILHKHGGTWDKFVGDAMLAYFGAPGHQSDHAVRAVACAVEMLEVVETLRNMGDIPFHVGIGINSGMVKVGHIGADATETSEEQKQFTIIGDTVNLAARLCGQAEGGSVLVSESTYEQLDGRFQASLLGPIPIKGKVKEVRVYRLLPGSPEGEGAAREESISGKT